MPSRPTQHRPPWANRGGLSQEQRYDRRRGSAARRGYDADWQQLRAAHLRENPWCVFCAEAGETKPAVEVDHIVEVRLAPERRLDPTNLRSLCKPHHSQRTHRGRPR
ncbi:MAG TPA: HNH endonuclease signature motif containing protein [Solirubrobacteraceae bacterium]|nr:HNH endonuclease signature motif containing protein [Solirubrobacteraceae bacterium]